jgi:hypothetical protein
MINEYGAVGGMKTYRGNQRMVCVQIKKKQTCEHAGAYIGTRRQRKRESSINMTGVFIKKFVYSETILVRHEFS